MRRALVFAASLAFMAAVRSAVNFSCTVVVVDMRSKDTSGSLAAGFPPPTICFRVRSASLGVALVAVLSTGAGNAAIRSGTEAAGLLIDGPALDIAFVENDVVAVLLDGGVALYRREGAALRRTDHRSLESSLAVRAPAGIIVAETGAFWVGTNRAKEAILFAAEGGRLQETQRAAALPFPGSPQGARFDEGTNLVEVTVPRLGSGPHLRAGSGSTPWAIAPDGRLGTAAAGWTETRVGSAAAELWPGTWIASSLKPPAHGDALSMIRLDGPPTVVASFPAPSSVTAIGARGSGDLALVVAAVTDGEQHRLVFMELARDRP